VSYALYRTHLGATTTALQDGLAVLSAQPCYSRQLDDCMVGRNSALPGCTKIQAAYRDSANKTPLDAAIDRIPFCPAPEVEPIDCALAAVGGLAAGLLFAVVFKP